MSERVHIPAAELAGVYNAIEFYVKYRYQEIDIEDLKAIRRLLHKIEADYKQAYRQADDFDEVRKRKAGRKSSYTEENRQAIEALYRDGHPIRRIAEMTGSTHGRVNAVIKKLRDGERQIKTNDRFWDVLDKWIAEEGEGNE